MKAIITDGIVSVVLTESQEERMLQLAADAYSKAKAEQEVLSKVYEVKTELVHRLKMSTSSIYDAINAGRLRVTLVGKKKGYRVTELACREFLGDIKKEK